MALLTDTHKAIMRSVQARALTASADIWRSPAPGVGRVGASTQIAAAAPCQIWPATSNNTAVHKFLALPEIAAARASHLAFFLDDIDIRAGDELRHGTARYKIEQVATMTTMRAAALSLVTP